MRLIVLLIAALLPLSLAFAQEPARPISPEEALKRVDQKVIVLMEVKSTGGNTARFLNSQADFRDEKNFAIFIPNVALATFKKAGIADPGQHFKGKTIQVTGQVSLSQERPVLRVEIPSQIKLVENDAPRPLQPKRPIQK